MRLRTAIVAAFVACGSYPALAAPPSALFNKTIRISYAIYRPNRGADGSSVTTPRRTSMTIYISSVGRVFDKTIRRNGKFGRDSEYAPEQTSGSFQFSGSKMVGTARSGNAAKQMTVAFDSNFQSCTVEIRSGGENGSPMVWTGLNGIKYTATGPATYSAQACSIEAGNGLSN
jgi:hypothetical protein